MILPKMSGCEEEGLVHEAEVTVESLFNLKISGSSMLLYVGPEKTFIFKIYFLIFL